MFHYQAPLLAKSWLRPWLQTNRKDLLKRIFSLFSARSMGGFGAGSSAQKF